MKFFSNTPLAQRHGINMLLPVAVSAEALQPTGASSSADHTMANAEEDVNMAIAEEDAKPEPPDDPIIEDPEEE